ncbi:MAG: hypothetical protein ABF260_06270 [Flavobacteriaceae bacterium]
MIEQLKHLIEEKIKRKVKTRGDCEFISNAILETLNIEISYSTIKRFYGLNTSTTPNNRTLNTLSQFVGYKNYFHFTEQYLFKDKNKLNYTTYKLVFHEDNNSLLNLVSQTKSSSENFTDFIIILIRELWHNENYDLINSIFELDALKSNSFTYSELLYIGNSIGLLIQKKKKINNQLLSNINFLECIYSTFVDYSNLNNYYGKSADIISNQKPTKELHLFSSALSQLKNYLNKKSVSLVNKELIYSKEIHPILCSRLLSLYFLTSNKTAVQLTLNSYFELHDKRVNLIDYSHELFTTAILTKNVILMEYLINKINLDLSISFLYQKYHLNSFYLMCMFYYRITNDSINELKFQKLFSLNNCTIGYGFFIQTLYFIFMFEITKDNLEKSEIKKEYNALSKKLNYPIFSESFLTDYFE